MKVFAFLFKPAMYLFSGKSNFISSLALGIPIAKIFAYIQSNTPSEMFGFSIKMWALIFAFNTWDIITGIRADTKIQKRNGGKFKFNPDKGIKAFEKFISFTGVIWFLYMFESESIRLSYSENITSLFNYSKFVFFFYVILIELKSIGRHNEEIYGQKSEMFKMLESIISIVNDAILGRLRKIGGLKPKENEEITD